MNKYTYKFESVKKVKKTLEKKTQKELAEINVKIDDLTDKCFQVEEEKGKTLMMMKESRNIKAAEIHNYIGRKNYLESLVDNYKHQISVLQKEKVKKIVELEQKSKEHKIFEKLDEINYSEHLAESNRQEQMMIDEIAIKKKEARQ